MGERDGRYSPQNLLGFKVRKLHNKLSQQWMDLARSKNVEASPVQAGILLFIDANSGLSQKDLAQLLGVDASTLSQALNPLLQRNLVERIPLQKDKRRFQLTLTDEGKKMACEVRKVVALRQQLLPGNLNRDELEVLHGLLDRLVS
jgi:DNA-binding MarR family transcriptional regulator